MLAPEPVEEIFTEGLRTVKADVPLIPVPFFLRFVAAFSTFAAVLVGGGGAAGGPTGSGIVGVLGADKHIIILSLKCFRFEFQTDVVRSLLRSVALIDSLFL